MLANKSMKSVRKPLNDTAVEKKFEIASVITASICSSVRNVSSTAESVEKYRRDSARRTPKSLDQSAKVSRIGSGFPAPVKDTVDDADSSDDIYVADQ